MEENINNRSPLEYARVIFRRKWYFVAPLFAGLVISIIACFLLPPTYESSTVILVEEEKIINPLIKDLAVSTSVAQRMRTLQEQILSWKSLVKLTQKLNLAKDANNQMQFEKLILGLRKNIVVKQSAPNIIRLSYLGKIPEETQVVAKTLTDIFIEQNMQSQTKETDVAVDFIKEQLRVYKNKIKQSEVAQLEEQLKKLLVDSTEEHPLVKELQQKIASAKSELDGADYQPEEQAMPINSPIYESLKQELDKAIAKGGAVDSSMAYALDANEEQDPNSTVYKLLLMDKLDSVMARDMRVNENIYNMLLQKLETAKITQRLEVSKEGTRYTILDPPRLPLKPVKPNKAVVIFLGIFLGGSSGIGLVLAREFSDQSILDIEDAKESLDLPILGAISRLTTEEEITKEQSQQKKIIAISLVTSGVFIVIAMLVSLLGR
jgi:uncharacterized protein involved in exopolysaccharide biosynthesis